MKDTSRSRDSCLRHRSSATNSNSNCRRKLSPTMVRWTLWTVLVSCLSWRTCGFSFMSQRPQGKEVVNVERCRGAPRQDLIAPLSATSPSGTTTSSSSAITADWGSSAAAVLDFYADLDRLYERSNAIKCPFFRRRAADLIDGAAMVVQFLLIRHKSLPGISDLFLDNDPSSVSFPADEIRRVFSAPGCKPLGRHIKRHPDGTAQKTRGLSVSEISERIRADWTGGVAGTEKGYYITGKLDSTIYRDNCLFTGPDPDMPVRGLRKYLSAAAHLFDPRESDAELLSIESHEKGGEKGHGMIEVMWRLGGVIQLPWHPTVEPWTGTTFYHLDEEGLIYLHEEEWDISVWKAFICTLIPEAKDWKIWNVEGITALDTRA